MGQGNENSAEESSMKRKSLRKMRSERKVPVW